MKFEKAAKLMKEGKKITDKAWDGCNHLYSNGNRIFDKFGKEYALSLINLESTSWEEYVELKKSLSDKIRNSQDLSGGMNILFQDDVKEAIKESREDLFINICNAREKNGNIDFLTIREVIDTNFEKHFGEELI